MKKTERLVDVVKKDHVVLHTFPITVIAEQSEVDTAARTKAIQAAAHARLVPASEFNEVTARLHPSRGGPLAPFGDCRPVLIETQEYLEQDIRDRAYRLWEQEGRPDGKADEHWSRARHQHLCERAYALWDSEGCQDGCADQNWLRTERFGEC